MNDNARHWLTFLGFVIALGGGAARAQEQAQPGVVICADGSGHLRNMSADLATAVCASGLPLQVGAFDWSHGPGRIMSDLRGRAYHCEQGQRLADWVLAFRASNPGSPIFLVGHSSGAAVILAAAERLPPCSVNGIILLAPAVSPQYDLGCALQASAGGLDSFYSPRDLISRAQLLSGTADGHFAFSAGCTPFVSPGCCGAGDGLAGLRQHQYGERGGGGHFDCTRVRFLRERVVPLLCPSQDSGATSNQPSLTPE